MKFKLLLAGFLFSLSSLSSAMTQIWTDDIPRVEISLAKSSEPSFSQFSDPLWEETMLARLEEISTLINSSTDKSTPSDYPRFMFDSYTFSLVQNYTLDYRGYLTLTYNRIKIALAWKYLNEKIRTLESKRNNNEISEKENLNLAALKARLESYNESKSEENIIQRYALQLKALNFPLNKDKGTFYKGNKILKMSVSKTQSAIRMKDAFLNDLINTFILLALLS